MDVQNLSEAESIASRTSSIYKRVFEWFSKDQSNTEVLKRKQKGVKNKRQKNKTKNTQWFQCFCTIFGIKQKKKKSKNSIDRRRRRKIMDASRKSLDCQMQVRRNAEELRTSFKELYDWEKEIKTKEEELQKRTTETDVEKLKTLPIRHAKVEQTNNKKKEETIIATDVIATDKNDIEPKKPCTPHDELRREANDIKNRGNTFVKSGDYEKAINEYSSAIDLFAKDPIFYSNRALCHLKLENYSNCIEDCERALAIDDKAVKALYRRMQANENLGNNLDALRDCTTILTLEPKNLEAKKSLERINKRLSSNAKTPTGCCFTQLNKNLVDILPFDKPAYKRSNKPLHRVPVVDIVAPKNTPTYEHDTLKISDEDIDKIFNSNCGPYVEIKKGTPEYEENERRKKMRSDESKIKDEIESITAAATTKTEKNEKNRKNSTDKKDIPAVEIKTATATTTTAQVIGSLEKTDKDKQNSTDALKSAVNKSTTNKIVSNKILDSTPTKIERPLPNPPKTTGEFYSNWKELSAAQKYEYLKSIPIPNLCKILGASFDSELLSDILLTLHDYYLPNKEITTGATLLEISKNAQLKILALLMSNDDHKALTKIIDAVKEHKSNNSVVDTIMKNFGISL